MGDSDTGQVSTAAAEVYDACNLPAIFAEWAPRVAAAAAIEPGQRVLDVACGSGVLAQSPLPPAPIWSARASREPERWQ